MQVLTATFEELNSKMTELVEVNQQVTQKLTDELNRFKITKSTLSDLGKKFNYLRLNEEENKILDPLFSYIRLVGDLFNEVVYNPELFDSLDYEAFSVNKKDHSLSEDEINKLYTLAVISIANAKKNQVLIEESCKDDNLEIMAKTIEEKRHELENQMKELTETLTQLELKPRDEAAIDKIKTIDLVKMAKNSSELQQVLRMGLITNAASYTVFKSISEMVKVQNDLLSAKELA